MNTMTTMYFINGEPVAIVGATRYYVTPALNELTNETERELILNMCDAMIGYDPYEPGGASPWRQARTD